MKEKKGVWRLEYLDPHPKYSDEQNDVTETVEST